VKTLFGVFALVLWASSAITSVRADDTLSEISRTVVRNSIICADFIQKKSLRVLERPLLSTGKVHFVADKGILWQVREPFPTRLLVKRDALIKWNDSGEPQRLSFAQSPIFDALARVFIAVFTGEVEPLRKNFEIGSHMENSIWRLTLTPRDKSLAQIFKRVHASGGRFVDELGIEERRGDHTQIKFVNMNTTSCQLDESEKGYFAQ
jgi:hypothetical protein